MHNFHLLKRLNFLNFLANIFNLSLAEAGSNAIGILICLLTMTLSSQTKCLIDLFDMFFISYIIVLFLFSFLVGCFCYSESKS